MAVIKRDQRFITLLKIKGFFKTSLQEPRVRLHQSLKESKTSSLLLINVIILAVNRYSFGKQLRKPLHSDKLKLNKLKAPH